VRSDLTIKLKGKDLPGHKFVLAARSDHWATDDLSHVSELDLSGKILSCHLFVVFWSQAKLCYFFPSSCFKLFTILAVSVSLCTQNELWTMKILT